MPTCAVGPCQEPREDGSSYCSKHGPRSAKSGTKTVTTKGTLRPLMVCPHCQEKGTVRTRTERRKAKGVSHGKAGAAVATAGFSLFAFGIGNSKKVTVAHCDHCKADWEF